MIWGWDILSENIDSLIRNLAFLKCDVENFVENPENNDFFEEIIKKVEKCDIFYVIIKDEILKMLKDKRKDIIEVKETENGIEFI